MGQPARQKTKDGQPISLCCIFFGLGLPTRLLLWAGHEARGGLFVKAVLLFPFSLSSLPG